MKILGFEITRPILQKALSPIFSRGPWTRVLESFTGAWQQNVEVSHDSVVSYATVFACTTLIAGDISKMRVKLVEQIPDSDVWREKQSAAFSPVLRKPNRMQNRVQFYQSWLTSKLIHGNTYALKIREQTHRNIVKEMFVLDPMRVKPLVSDLGEIFYELRPDNISGLPKQIVVPASEIIHDRMIPLFHPLIGVSPIFASGLAATQGLKIQNNSAVFFANMSQPGGILIAPGQISQTDAAELKQYWSDNFTEAKAGRIAVLSDGMKYERLSVNAVDSQLIDQLKWTSEQVCSCFHVPPYMVGIGPMPAYNNIEALTQNYYSQCLQVLIESLEICLDEGLDLPTGQGTEFDLKALLRMDTAARFDAHSKGISGGWMTPNEARAEEDLPPVKGGDTPYMQQQNWPLEQLTERPAPGTVPAPALPSPDRADGAGSNPDDSQQLALMVDNFLKQLPKLEGAFHAS